MSIIGALTCLTPFFKQIIIENGCVIAFKSKSTHIPVELHDSTMSYNTQTKKVTKLLTCNSSAKVLYTFSNVGSVATTELH